MQQCEINPFCKAFLHNILYSDFDQSDYSRRE